MYPEQYIVATFSKFLIDWFINPYLSLLGPHIPVIKVFSNKILSNYSKENAYNIYISKNKAGHYVIKDYLYLCWIFDLVNNQKNSY